MVYVSAHRAVLAEIRDISLTRCPTTIPNAEGTNAALQPLVFSFHELLAGDIKQKLSRTPFSVMKHGTTKTGTALQEDSL